MTRILPAAWARAERLYFEGETHLKDIAAACAMSLSSLRKRAQSRNWPPLSKLDLDGATSERVQLRRTIVKKLNHLETRMDQADTATPTDSERQSREYSSLLASVEKLDAKENAWKTKLISAEAGTDSTAEAAAPAPLGDTNVEHWRADLAQRIARLRASWDQ